MDFFIGGRILYRLWTGILTISNVLKSIRLHFVSYKHNFSLHNTLIDALESCSTEKNMSGWPHVHCITHVLIQNIVLLYWRHNCAKETCQHNKCG